MELVNSVFKTLDSEVSVLIINYVNNKLVSVISERQDQGGIKVKVRLSMKTYWRNGGIAPRILNVGTRWR
jgi:hypothetical protein